MPADHSIFAVEPEKTPPTQQPPAPTQEPKQRDHSIFAMDPHEAFAEPPAQPQEQGNILTRSLIPGIGNTYDAAVKGIESKLPESMRGSYAEQLVGEVIKQGGHGMVDFMTSPVGIGLIAAHAIPVFAPFAALGDVAVGGYSALQSVPDIAAAIQDHSPQNVARVIVDLAGAYAGAKGGARVGGALRQIPAGTSIREMPGAYARALRTSPPPGAPSEGRVLGQRLEAAPEEDRPDILAEAGTPRSIRGALEQKIYRTPGVRAAANVILPGVKRPPIVDLGQHLVNTLLSRVEVEDNKARRVGDYIRRSVPEADQNIRRLGYAMEGDLPEADLSPEGRTALDKIRKLNRERDQMLRDSGVEDEALRDPDTYIRHYWDFREDPNSPAGKRIAARMMRDPSLRARTVGSLKQGIENGIDVDGENVKLRPLYENTADVIERRHKEAARAMANRDFADTLREYGLIVDDTRANRAATGWKSATDSPALARAMYAGKTEAGETIMRPRAPLVHPDIEMAVNAIFNEPMRGPIWNAVDQLRGFSKQLQVGFSLFHNNALSEVSQAHGIAAGGLRAIPRFVRAVTWPLDPEFRKGLKAGIWEIRGKVAPDAPPDIRLSADAVRPWLEAGSSMRSSEAESAAIRAGRQFLAERGPVLRAIGSPFRRAADLQHVFNRALFDYYLPGQMLHASEALFTREMNRLGPHATEAQKFDLRRDIADHVNRSFGADNLTRLMLTPKAQQALGFAFFAPMWTLSNLRVLTKGFETTTGKRLTSRYIAGAALTWLLTTELANYAFSSWAAKDPNGSGGQYWDNETQQWKRGGHWTWQNSGVPTKIGGKYVPVGGGQYLSDNAANIYIGQNSDGSERYIRLGKAFREPFLWMTHTGETLGNKMSAPMRTLSVAISGKEPFSDYPVTEGPTPGGRTPGGVKAERFGKFVAEQVVPFSAQHLLEQGARAVDPQVFREPGPSTQIVGLPSRKGVSFTNAYAAYKEARDAGRGDIVAQIVEAASRNGLSVSALQNKYDTERRQTQRIERGRPKTQTPPAAPRDHSIFATE